MNLKKLFQRKRKVEPTYRDIRMQQQTDYIARSQTPETRVDAMQKRINDRKTRR